MSEVREHHCIMDFCVKVIFYSFGGLVALGAVGSILEFFGKFKRVDKLFLWICRLYLISLFIWIIICGLFMAD